MKKIAWVLLGFLIGVPLFVIGQDWYAATGNPVQGSQMSSSVLRAEFAAIEDELSAKLPILTGNGLKLVRVNSAGTALETLSTVGLTVANGGTSATTLTGILQGNGTSAITGITNSTTVGQTFRVTGSNTYGWGALNLADGDAITGDIPDANLSANAALYDASMASFSAGTLNDARLSSNYTVESGTFTFEFDDACTTTPSMVVDWRRIGNIVVLQQVGGSLTCTSNSANMSATVAAVPAGIRPNTSITTSIVQGCITSSANSSCMVQIATDGTASVNAETAWSGTVAPPTNWTVSYILGNP